MSTVLFCQLALLLYHQLTPLVDLFPFNGSRNYTWKEKLAECKRKAMTDSQSWR